MIILWIFKGKRNEQPHYNENSEASFQKHDESMRMFRSAHPKVEQRKSTDVRRTDWPALVPIRQVKLAKYLQN